LRIRDEKGISILKKPLHPSFSPNINEANPKLCQQNPSLDPSLDFFHLFLDLILGSYNFCYETMA